MNRGNLVFVGDLSTPTAENAGSLVISNGLNNVQTIASGSGTPASLTFTNGTTGFSRTGGVVNFVLDPNVSLNFTTAPATPNGIIGGYATVNTNDWATISSNKVVAYSGYTVDDGTNNTVGSWLGTQNIDLQTTNTETVAAPTSINSIRFSGAGARTSRFLRARPWRSAVAAFSRRAPAGRPSAALERSPPALAEMHR